MCWHLIGTYVSCAHTVRAAFACVGKEPAGLCNLHYSLFLDIFQETLTTRTTMVHFAFMRRFHKPQGKCKTHLRSPLGAAPRLYNPLRAEQSLDGTHIRVVAEGMTVMLVRRMEVKRTCDVEVILLYSIRCPNTTLYSPVRCSCHCTHEVSDCFVIFSQMRSESYNGGF